MAVELFFNPVPNIQSYCSAIRSADGEVYSLFCHFSSSRIEGHIKITWMKTSTKLIRVACYKDALCKGSHFNATVLFKDQTEAVLHIPHANTILVNITPQIHLTMRETMPSRKLQSKPCGKTLKKLEELSTDLMTLLQTGNHSDVVLTDGSTEIRAHKVLLSARSSVFEKMFQHPMKENRENKITIPDFSIKVLEEMLHFMYSGSITVRSRSMVLDLFVAADKYDVKGLKDICVDELRLVDSKNVLDTLILAKFYDNKILKEACLAFAAKNYAELKKLPEWDKFKKENETLAVELLSFVIDDKIE